MTYKLSVRLLIGIGLPFVLSKDLYLAVKKIWISHPKGHELVFQKNYGMISPKVYKLDLQHTMWNFQGLQIGFP